MAVYLAKIIRTNGKQLIDGVQHFQWVAQLAVDYAACTYGTDEMQRNVNDFTIVYNCLIIYEELDDL